MSATLTLGSLFDGIGGFPLAARMTGIKTIWASEIEPIPVSTTKRHFPEMKHLGDIRKINGTEIEPVDIITFGSPCQDLSVAGKRAGLEGGRSGLFTEAVWIIKEMRNATNRIRPRFAVWENVLGAFSSNEGEDFRTVLQEIAAIAEPGVSIPRPSSRDDNKESVWEFAGAVVGDGWSLAWRVLDAQYWGVPQRRKRIFLVADFRGECAGEILFKPEGLQGDTAESGAERKGITAEAERSAGAAGFIGNMGAKANNIGYEEEKAPTLKAGQESHVVVYPEVVGSLIARADGSPCVDRGQPFIFDARGNGDGETANTLTGDHQNRVRDYTALVGNYFSFSNFGKYDCDGTASTLRRRDNRDSADLIINEYVIRRLTPTECERLMGFFDGWTEYGHDGKKISDSARYKATGNSLAIPCVKQIMTNIKGVYEMRN